MKPTGPPTDQHPPRRHRHRGHPGMDEAALAASSQQASGSVVDVGPAEVTGGDTGTAYFSTGPGSAESYHYSLQGGYREAVAQGLANPPAGG